MSESLSAYRICRNCEFYMEFNAGRGTCHRYPPPASWEDCDPPPKLRVPIDYWCGEWRVADDYSPWTPDEGARE